MKLTANNQNIDVILSNLQTEKTLKSLSITGPLSEENILKIAGHLRQYHPQLRKFSFAPTEDKELTYHPNKIKLAFLKVIEANSYLIKLDFGYPLGEDHLYERLITVLLNKNNNEKDQQFKTDNIDRANLWLKANAGRLIDSILTDQDTMKEFLIYLAQEPQQVGFKIVNKYYTDYLKTLPEYNQQERTYYPTNNEHHRDEINCCNLNCNLL